MSARYDGAPVQPPSTYEQYPPRDYDARGANTMQRASPTSPQLPRLPSLSTWASFGPNPPLSPLESHPGEPRTDTDRSGHRPSSHIYSSPQHNYETVKPALYAPVPPLHAGPTSDALYHSERGRPEMCFRSNSYSRMEKTEPQPRPTARPVMQETVAARNRYEYPVKASYAGANASYSAMGAPKRPDMLVKRQARSPAPQLQPTKRTRDQSPPIVRPSVRVRDLVPNLLSQNKAHLVRNLKFTLRIRQQPQQARSCGFADKDRRAIDPPPIVELVINGEGLSKQELESYLYHDRYVMCCTLLDEKGVDAMNMEQDGLRSKRMMGENSAVPFVGADEHGAVGCFFAFNDLSCRTPGDYRLSFNVSVLPDPEESKAGIRYPRIGDITSDVFKAYNAKSFPGMTESSPLARALKEQGCNISVRKGNEKTKNSRGRNSARDDDEDEDY